VGRASEARKPTHRKHPFLLNYPQSDYVYNLDQPMYFGLSPEFTDYYDNLNNAAHLHFETTGIIRLLNLGRSKPQNASAFELINHLDGYLAYDDVNDYF
jgi:hypothetical protein